MSQEFPEITAEHDFRTATLRATREVIERVTEGEWKPVLDALQSHPFPKHINFEEILLQTISDNFPVIFDGVMDYVFSHCSFAHYIKCLRYATVESCRYNFLHALERESQWVTTTAEANLKFRNHLLDIAAQNGSAACLKFVMPLNAPLGKTQWIDLVGYCIASENAATLDFLLNEAPDVVTYHEKLGVLPYLIGRTEQSKDFQEVLFDHFALTDFIDYVAFFNQHATITQLYEEHHAKRAHEAAQRIEEHLTLPTTSRERKL